MTQQTYPIKCRILAEATATRVDVYDDIGEGGWFSEGLTAKAFAAQLAGIKGPLDVHINSCGGNVGDGIAIGNTIRNYKGFKRTVVDGIAASIASIIAQAGDERVVEPGSMTMIHDALTVCYGNAADMSKTAETLDKHSNNLAGIYAERAGGTVEQWREVMQAETWYTADEAVTAGLADRLGDGDAELPAGMDLAAFQAVPGRIAARMRAMPQAKAPVVVDADGNHAPMTGSHSHSHPAYSSQGGDSTHAHDHSHDGDASHDHGHGDDGASDHGRSRPRGEAPGRCCELCGPDCECMSGSQSARSAGRILGVESMPVLDGALPVHHTATTDEAWDGPAAVAAMPADDAVLRYCHAWIDADAAAVPHREDDDDADDQKGNYKFPHHKTKGGPANLAACRNGLVRLSSADIPSGDDAGVKAHLQAHLDDGAGDGADDHAPPDITGIDLDDIRAALRGATTE